MVSHVPSTRTRGSILQTTNSIRQLEGSRSMLHRGDRVRHDLQKEPRAPHCTREIQGLLLQACWNDRNPALSFVTANNIEKGSGV